MKLSERLTHLGDILIALSASPIPSQQFQTLAEEAGKVLSFDYLGVCLLDPDQKGYRVHSLVGAAGNAIAGRLFRLDEGVAGLVLRTGRTSLCDDVGSHPQGTQDVEGVARQLGLRAALVLPVRQGSTVIGAIYFAAQPPTVYDLEDMQIGNLISASLSSAMEMSHLYQTLADDRSVLAAVLASTKDGIIVVNTQGQVLLANPSAGRLLGISAEALTGVQFAEAVMDSALVALVRASDTQRTVELPLPDGRLAQASLVEVTTSFGESVGTAIVLHDVTVQNRLDQMKNEFVQTVSHDLKNPITSISLATDWLLRSESLDLEARDAVRQIRETADYMGDLVGDLLELGRIEAGLGLSIAQLDYVKLTRDVIADLYPQVEAGSLAISLEAEGEPMVSGDSERLRQVLINVLDNAIKYTPAGGEIVVTIAVAKRHVITAVTDTGVGIPVTSLPHVFDKFFRVRTEATAHIQGTGLGLAITRGIVEAHGGRISVESQEGKGTTFTFTMPLASERNA